MGRTELVKQIVLVVKLASDADTASNLQSLTHPPPTMAPPTMAPPTMAPPTMAPPTTMFHSLSLRHHAPRARFNSAAERSPSSDFHQERRPGGPFTRLGGGGEKRGGAELNVHGALMWRGVQSRPPPSWTTPGSQTIAGLLRRRGAHYWLTTGKGEGAWRFTESKITGGTRAWPRVNSKIRESENGMGINRYKNTQPQATPQTQRQDGSAI